MTSTATYSCRLCRLDELDDPGSKGFSVSAPGGTTDILVVRHENRVYGYLNNCPHTGAPLDWLAGQFLDQTREFIQCATHGALFRLEDGLCVYGPCAGDRLAPVSATVVNGEVIATGTSSGSADAKE